MEPTRPPILPPGPSGLPLFGQSFEFIRDPFGFFDRLRDSYAPVSFHKSMGVNFLAIFEPEYIEHVLVKNAKNYEKDRFLKSWKEVFGQGLLTSEGEVWKRERRMIQPAFHRDRIAGYVDLMEKTIQARVEAWSAGQVFEAHKEMSSLTLEIVVRILFGSEIDPDQRALVAKSLEESTRYFEYTMGPFGQLFQKLPFPPTVRYHRAVGKLNGVLRSMISQKRRQINQNTDKNTDKNTEEKPEANDLLSALLRARDEDGSSLSDAQLRDELMTLFLAGHETTALALTFTLFLIATHAETQNKIHEEVDRLFPTGSLPTAQSIGDAVFLNQVLNESMRLYPPAWIIAREAKEEDRMGPYLIPKGADVSIPIWALHRNPKWYSHPTEFQPERWTPEFRQKLPRSAFIPFGYGPRMCIGFQFAMQEALLILIALLRKFKIEALQTSLPKLRPSITLKPGAPVEIRLKSREPVWN